MDAGLWCFGTAAGVHYTGGSGAVQVAGWIGSSTKGDKSRETPFVRGGGHSSLSLTEKQTVQRREMWTRCTFSNVNLVFYYVDPKDQP